MRLTAAGVFRVAGFQLGDAFLRQKREVLEVTHHIAVVGANPELVKLVDARASRIEPHCARLSLAEFRAVGIGDERQGEAVHGGVELASTQLDTGGDVAPLIAAADLQLAIVRFLKMIKIEGLQEHVGKLGVADAHLAILHAGAYAFLGHHAVDGEVLANVAQEIEIGNTCRPVGVIQQLSGVSGGFKIQQLGQLLLHRRNVLLKRFACK